MQNRLSTATFVRASALWLILVDWSAASADQAAAPANLPQAFRQAADQFDPIEEAEIEQAQKRLVAAVSRLNEYLQSGPHGDDWKHYLRFDRLRQTARAKQPELDPLVQSVQQLTKNYVGLELKPFTDVSDTLQSYIDLLVVARMEQPTEVYRGLKQSLAESLAQYVEAPSDEARWRIGQRLGALAVGRQAPELVEATRRSYSHPNFHAEAAIGLVDQGIVQKIDQRDEIRDNILGTSIRGTGHTKAELDVAGTSGRTATSLELILKGTVESETVGYQGPVAIYTDSLTRFHATKKIVLEDEGFRALGAQAKATTRSHTRCVSAGPVVRRIAWRKIAENRGRADRIASRKAEDRIEKAFDERTVKLVERANRDYARHFRYPLLRKRALPKIEFGSTNDVLHLTVLHANRFQLAAPGPPPEWETERRDLGIRVHESIASNLAEVLFGSRTFSDESIRAYLQESLGELPPAMQQADEEPWSITFARHRPITVDFQGGGFRVTIRGQSYTSGGQSYEAMNIRAAYTIERQDGDYVLVRNGEVEIAPPGFDPQTDKLSARQVALHRIIETKMERLFKARRLLEGLELRGDWKRVGRLLPIELKAQDGWLSIAWRISEDKQASARQTVRTTR